MDDMFDDTAMRRMLLRWQLEQASADGKTYRQLKDSDTSGALLEISALAGAYWIERWGKRLDELDKIDDDEKNPLAAFAIVAKLLERFAIQAAEGSLRVMWRPCDNDVLWDMPGLDEPDDDGNCRMCGSLVDHGDYGDEDD